MPLCCWLATSLCVTEDKNIFAGICRCWLAVCCMIWVQPRMVSTVGRWLPSASTLPTAAQAEATACLTMWSKLQGSRSVQEPPFPLPGRSWCPNHIVWPLLNFLSLHFCCHQGNSSAQPGCSSVPGSWVLQNPTYVVCPLVHSLMLYLGFQGLLAYVTC